MIWILTQKADHSVLIYTRSKFHLDFRHRYLSFYIRIIINAHQIKINVKMINIHKRIDMENRTARLTLLIDPQKKAMFEKLCGLEDLTASQKVRQMIREYLEQNLGSEWRTQVFDQNAKIETSAKGSSNKKTSDDAAN